MLNTLTHVIFVVSESESNSKTFLYTKGCLVIGVMRDGIASEHLLHKKLFHGVEHDKHHDYYGDARAHRCTVSVVAISDS